MSPLTFAIIEAIPLVIQLVIGLIGLIFSIKGRPSGVPGLMVGAFVLVLVTTVGGIAWQFVSLNASSWAEEGHLTSSELDSIFMGVDLPLGIISALSWLLVAIAVAKTGRPPQQYGPATYAGQPNYPMGPQPGFAPPQPGYPQQPAYPQPAYPQPGYPQQPGYEQPGYPQPNPGTQPPA